jgi:hypothetical protein
VNTRTTGACKIASSAFGKYWVFLCSWLFVYLFILGEARKPHQRRTICLYYCCPPASKLLSRLQLYCGENVHELREGRKRYASDSNMSHPCSLMLTGNAGSHINSRFTVSSVLFSASVLYNTPVYYTIHSEEYTPNVFGPCDIAKWLTSIYTLLFFRRGQY